MAWEFFDKKLENAYKIATGADKFASGGAIGNKTISNQQLTEELHKPIIRKF